MDSRVVDNPAVYSPHLKKVLKSFQMTSMRSLNGPDTRSVYGLSYSLHEKDMSSPLLTQYAVTNSSLHNTKNSVVSCGDEVYYKKRHKVSVCANGVGGGGTNGGGGGVAVAPSSNSISTSSVVVGKAKNSLLNMTGDNNNNNNNNSSEASSISANNNIKITSSKLESGGGGCKGNNGTVENGGGQFGDERESFENDVFLGPPPFPIQQVPILTAPDQGWSESKTLLEGELISCFVVGGEKRLCLPQILNSVLRQFGLPQINAVCDNLQIYCSRCNQEQLSVLKVAGILPPSAPSCGLVTKTDCERLCSALLHQDLPKLPKDFPKEKRPFHFRIYHECFGKCAGLYSPDDFTSPNAECIECEECHGLMSPQIFVGHVHDSMESRTCHWGFDSMSWRFYVMLSKGQDNMNQLKSLLDEMKDRFDNTKNNQKRKQSRPTQIKAEAIEVDDEEGRASGQHVSMGEDEDEEVKEDAPVIKKRKPDITDNYLPYVFDPVAWHYSLANGPYTHHANPSALSRLSAFRPWSPILTTKEGKYNLSMPPNTVAFVRDSVSTTPLPPYISRGPPVLLNPERVVPMSETERFERHYQPNVALAPPSAQIQAKLKAHEFNSSQSSVQKTSLNLSNRPKQQLSPANKRLTESVAASSTTTTSSLARTQPPIQLRAYNEFDLSTDTDETFSDSTTYSTSGSPSLCNPRNPVPDSQEKQTEDTFLTEMKQLREVLEEEVTERDARDKVLNGVARICYSLEHKLQKAESSNRQLQQELELMRMSKRDRLRQALESKRQLRMEINRMMQEQVRLESQIEKLRNITPVSSSLHNRRIVLKQEQIDDDELQVEEGLGIAVVEETVEDAADTQEETERANQQSVEEEEVEDVKPNLGLLQASVSSGY
ncbi:hypothetical protein CHUAL_006717 [Chamberlinius hualienensis]